MDGNIVPGGSRRKRLLQLCRAGPDPRVRLRAHVLLLLADGFTRATITAVPYCSTATIDRWKGRFERGGGSRPCRRGTAAGGRR
jgi:hypothetical protein